MLNSVIFIKIIDRYIVDVSKSLPAACLPIYLSMRPNHQKFFDMQSVLSYVRRKFSEQVQGKTQKINPELRPDRFYLYPTSPL